MFIWISIELTLYNFVLNGVNETRDISKGISNKADIVGEKVSDGWDRMQLVQESMEKDLLLLLMR